MAKRAGCETQNVVQPVAAVWKSGLKARRTLRLLSYLVSSLSQTQQQTSTLAWDAPRAVVRGEIPLNGLRDEAEGESRESNALKNSIPAACGRDHRLDDCLLTPPFPLPSPSSLPVLSLQDVRGDAEVGNQQRLDAREPPGQL